MTKHMTGTRKSGSRRGSSYSRPEKELTRRSDELAGGDRSCPGFGLIRITASRPRRAAPSLADLFRGRSQLLVYHFMFGPDYTAGCPACSAIADGFNGFVVHLANHDVMLCAVSRAPLAKLQEYKRRMGWSFPWASSFGSEFNYHFQVTFTEEQQQSGVVEYNFRAMDRAAVAGGRPEESARRSWSWHGRGDGHAGTPGMSAFALEDGVVYHTYSAYVRGLDGLWGMYQWLDRAPRGRNESLIAGAGDLRAGVWFRRHDEYDSQ